jgi:uncharacterized protein DUF6182
MRLTQEVLHDHVVRRIRAVRPELTRLSTTADLVATQAKLTEASETVVCCVVRKLELATFIRGAYTFVAGLTGDRLPAWRRSFTKTIFLAGNPVNLTKRFRFDHVTDDHLAAWTPPSTPDELTALRRLLKTFDGPLEVPADRALTVTLPGTRARTRRLYLATAGVSTAEAVVHLNHLLAEAVLDGQLGPGDRLVLRQVPRLVGVPEPFDALRIGIDPTAPNRLRAFAGLTKEINR